MAKDTAWHLMHRIREMLRETEPELELLDGDVECDKSFIGGKDRWKHKDKKVPNSRGRSTKAKTPILLVWLSEAEKPGFGLSKIRKVKRCKRRSYPTSNRDRRCILTNGSATDP